MSHKSDEKFWDTPMFIVSMPSSITKFKLQMAIDDDEYLINMVWWNTHEHVARHLVLNSTSVTYWLNDLGQVT